MKTPYSLSIAFVAGLLSLNASAQTTAAEFKVPPESSIPSDPKGVAIQEGKKLLTETHQRLPKNVGNGLIPFPDRYDIRREAVDSALARQSEATTCRIDMEMELPAPTAI